MGAHEQDQEYGRGRDRERDSRGASYDDEDNREKYEGTPMDEDERGEDDDDDVVVDDSMDAMKAMMGFGGFGSTKGTKIPGNNVGAVRKEKTTEYRQYMNRVGGFNRPLSPGR